jgi:hypothetical protein
MVCTDDCSCARALAADDLRSLNSQIEYLLRRELGEARRLPQSVEEPAKSKAGAR